MSKLAPIYPITDLALSRKSTHLEIVKELIGGGATLIQLREKNLNARDFFDQARQAIAYARKRGVRIIINDRVDIALAADADGVHLGQDDLPVEKARRLLGTRKLIGISTHNIRQAMRASATLVDYLSIGPIFQTSTKESANPTLGIEFIRKLRNRITKPIVAIGGITLDRSASVLAAGADSVAVISDLLKQGDLRARMKLYLKTLEKAS
jgi:thiamine-phosphate pyrophosphorylase